MIFKNIMLKSLNFFSSKLDIVILNEYFKTKILLLNLDRTQLILLICLLSNMFNKIVAKEYYQKMRQNLI